MLSDHHYELLRLALEASDRAAGAEKVLQAEGLFVSDRYGSVKAHPAVRVKESAESLVARLWRELTLSDEPELPRPPRLGGRTR